MKIVQINAVIEYSSTGRSTSELHQALKEAGHDSWVAAPNAPNSADSIKIGSKSDHLIHGLYSRFWGRQGFASHFATKKLIKKLDKIKPDVVHLRNLHSNYINLPIILTYLSRERIPTVITLHDCWPFTGHCCHFIDSKCDNWKHGCGNCPDLKNWNNSWFFDRTKQNLQDKAQLLGKIPQLAVIGVSDWVTGFVKDSILKDAAIVRRIYNWINLSIFSYQSNARSEIVSRHNLSDAPIILGVSQIWSRQKGILDFIELAKLMPEYNFILIGNVIEPTNLPSNIKAVGTTSSTQELAKYYSAADVFFNPSTRETFGKVTAEAIACSTPVVAYNATATPELIGPGCGALIQPSDIDAAKTAIIEIVNGPSLRKNCREFAEKTFNKTKLIEDHITLYKELQLGRN